MAGSKRKDRCECFDRADGHLTSFGEVQCGEYGRLKRLYRVDQQDETGTAFCRGCATDAMESGLFTNRRPRSRRSRGDR